MRELSRGRQGRGSRWWYPHRSLRPHDLQGDMVSLSWQLRLSKTGAPDITATGVEHAKYTDGAISRLEDVFDEGIAEGLGEWMAAHGDSLDG